MGVRVDDLHALLADEGIAFLKGKQRALVDREIRLDLMLAAAAVRDHVDNVGVTRIRTDAVDRRIEITAARDRIVEDQRVGGTGLDLLVAAIETEADARAVLQRQVAG